MNIAIIGAGLIGNKRANALESDNHLLYVCDQNLERVKTLAEKYGAFYGDNPTRIAERNDIDIVIISVTNKFITPMAIEMLESGKHIFCEKPLGRNYNESKAIVEKANRCGKIVKTGFNHRFHPAINRAKEIIDQGGIGKILYIRTRYGHGGRPGMENEWRCSIDLSGGGELLDQGVHLIDLCRWFTGEVQEVYGKVFTFFWPIQVEDNAFFMLSFDNDVVAQCHASWTNWKNIFSFEIHGTDGYIKIEGLGGSYGMESLEFGKRNKKGGKPDIEYYEYPEEDISWKQEWKEFKQSIEQNREPIGSGDDGLMAHKIIDAIYKSNELNMPITL